MANHVVKRGFLLALTALAIGSLSAQESIQYLPNYEGSAQDRQTYFHLPEGSERVPLRLLKALKSVETGKPFLQDIERMGFLSDPDNPDGLAIGMAAGPPADPKMAVFGEAVGFNCAACHTGEFKANGKRVRIIGAPAKADFEAFANDLKASGKATLKKPTELVAFLFRFGFPPSGTGWSPAKLSSLDPKVRIKAIDELAKQEITPDQLLMVNYLRTLTAQPDKELPFVMDTAHATLAMHNIEKKFLNSVEVQSVELRAPVHADVLPLEIKSLADLAETWKSEVTVNRNELPDIPGMMESVTYSIMKETENVTARGVAIGRVDAFGKARKVIFGQDPMAPAPVSYPHLFDFKDHHWLHWDGNTDSITERNVGQAVGVEATFHLASLATSANVRNIVKLEKAAQKIRPPKWPVDILGKLADDETLARGKQLYANNCFRCHDTKAGQDYLMFTPEEVGTDPLRATQFARKLVPSYQNESDYSIALGKVLYETIKKAIEHSDPETWNEVKNKGKWRTVGKYVARPLKGVWATAPYLHNNSVPSLAVLLQKPADRPTRFYVGNWEYDVKNLGYANVAGGTPNSPQFNTELPGNSNRGHDYGTGLTPEQKADLIEYLKTL